MNTISFLLLGIIGSFIIGKINKSSKIFMICMLALTFGFCIGSAVDSMKSKKTSKDTTVEAVNVINYDYNMLLAATTPVVKRVEETAKPIVGYYNRNYKKIAITVVNKLDMYPRCMSPPPTIKLDTLTPEIDSS